MDKNITPWTDSGPKNSIQLRDDINLRINLIWNHSEKAREIYLQFLTAEIRNTNTRVTYSNAIRKFSDWLDSLSLQTNSEYTLENVEPFLVAAYIEDLQNKNSLPTVKQNLSAINKLFNYLVINQVIPSNPAAPVKSPKYTQKQGKAPVLEPHEARTLLESIDTSTLQGKRDKALIALMIYSFAKVSAATNMRVKDFYQQGTRYFFRLLEKGGKPNNVPAHHEARILMHDYIESSNLKDDKDLPLFPSLSIKKNPNILSNKSMSRQDVFYMIRKRAVQAGLSGNTCCHTFRATGITTYLLGGGDIETAARIANHELTSTTKLYDRRNQKLTEGEIEKIKI